MPIYPLPQFEDDLKAQEEERRAIEALKPPQTIVVRFGRMRLIGEYPYRGDATPGCGSKIVVRTHRGLEIGDMLTVTCPNSGCATSISRDKMLEYIENSGGRQYPFYTNGRALRVATMEDLDRQKKLEDQSRLRLDQAKAVASRLGIKTKIIEVEPILSADRVTVYYQSEQRVDLRPLTQELAGLWKVRIDMRQVGARDEARLVADYERCGQYCCCKSFLKVLKPISMKAAKTQKATLDPLKISGRCGRLMCCLRYEEQTYDELKKNLPHRKTRVGTPEGDGIVIDSQILTQLVLVKLDGLNKQVAVPVEDLTEPGLTPRKKPEPEPGSKADDRATQAGSTTKKRRRRRKPRTEESSRSAAGDSGDESKADSRPSSPSRSRRRRRRSGGKGGPDSAASETRPGDSSKTRPSNDTGSADSGKRKRRRRRRRPGRPDSEGSGSSGPSSSD